MKKTSEIEQTYQKNSNQNGEYMKILVTTSTSYIVEADNPKHAVVLFYGVDSEGKDNYYKPTKFIVETKQCTEYCIESQAEDKGIIDSTLNSMENI